MAAAEVFPGVLGHESIQAGLVRALERGHLPHGLVFAGPRGVGKATLARGLACALHCSTRPQSGCGQCNACRRVLGGLHTGVEWIVPDTEGGLISVDAVRELRSRVEHAPFEGSAHVVVIDPGDALPERSANALLKILEEPPTGVHFVIIATSVSALLPTIVSRCTIIRFGRLSDREVLRILQSQDPPLSSERVPIAVQLASGSASAAIELAGDASLDALLVFLAQAVEAADRGPSAIFAGDGSSLWQAFSAAAGAGEGQKTVRERAVVARLVDIWLLHLRQRLRGQQGLPSIPCARDDQATLVRNIDLLHHLQQSLTRNANVRLALEHALLEWS